MKYSTKLIIALVLIYIFWSSTYYAIKVGTENVLPFIFCAIRFFIGGIILFLVTLPFYGLPQWKAFIGSFVLGISMVGIGTNTVSYSIQYLPTGIVATLVAMLPFWISVMDYLFFSHKKPSTLSALGMLLGFIGIVILVNPFSDLEISSLGIFPILVVFAGSICWSIGTLKSPSITQCMGWQSTAVQLLGASFISLVFSLALETNGISSLNNMTSTTYLAIAYLVVFGSYVGYSAFLWLIKNASPLLSTTYAYVNPLVAIIIGAIIGGEYLEPRVLIACMIILSGVILLIIGRRKFSLT